MTIDHPDMQAAGIPPTPAAIPTTKRIQASALLTWVCLRATASAVIRFWRRDFRWGDSYSARFEVGLTFDRED